eukprot:g41239.t1
MGGGGSTSIPILNNGRAQPISATDKAEAFAAIFNQKYRVNDPSWPSPVVPSITDTSLQPIQFTPSDIKKQLEVLDNAKALALDNILAIVLEACAPKLATPVAKLFQYCYNTGIYPATWKISQ